MEKLADKILNDIIDAALYKLAAAPKSFMGGARAAKPPAAGPIGTKANLSGPKIQSTQPTGKAVPANVTKQPVTSTGNLNDQLLLNTTLQSAGFKYPVTQTVSSSGGYPMMNQT